MTTNSNGPTQLVIPKDHSFGDGLSVSYYSRWAGDSISPQLLVRLLSAVSVADVVHLTAVYSFPTLPTLMICHILNKPLVWSPRGSLQRWSGSMHRRVKSYWEMLCRATIPERTILHATSEQEAGESLGVIPGVATAVIPNGIDVPPLPKERPLSDTLRLIFIGRLDPKKGIENLVNCCAKLSSQSPIKWTLKIVGSGTREYTAHLKSEVEQRGIKERVAFLGHLEGEQKDAALRSSDVMLMPSHTENFGLVTAEALAHGIPVIASRNSPWSSLESKGCGLWVENDPSALCDAIIKISGMPLEEMGRRGRHWMQTEFSWKERAREMRQLYDEVIG